jgi:hypothetical protein
MISLTACSALPQPPPVLPGSQQRKFTFSIVEGLPYAPTRAVVSSPETGSTTLHRRLEALEAAPVGVLFEPRLGVVHRVSDHLQWSGHLGWWMSGLELRILPWAAAGRTPVVVTTGAQVDAPPLVLGSSIPALWDVRAQISVHPAVHGIQTMLGAGFSVGRRKHDIYRPEGPLATYGVDQTAPVLLRALRQEARIEGVVGFAIDIRKLRFALAAQPFYVVAEGDVSTAYCAGCVEGLRVDSLDAAWGAVFTFALLL